VVVTEKRKENKLVGI